MRWLVGVALVLAVTGCSGSDETKSKPSSKGATGESSQADASPVPPEGMEFVGVGEVMVAVPQGLTRQVTRCGMGPCLTLYASSGGRASTSRLVIRFGDVEGRVWEDRTNVEPLETDSGLDGRVSDACPPTADCTFDYGKLVTVPSGRFTVVVTGARTDVEQVDEIVQSVKPIPEGYTTVPPLPSGTIASGAESALEAAGLDPYANHKDSDFPVYGTKPGAGAVAPEGSKVTLLWRPPDVMAPQI